MQKFEPQDTAPRLEPAPTWTVGAGCQPRPSQACGPIGPWVTHSFGLPQAMTLAQAHAAFWLQIWPRSGETSVQVLVEAFQVAAIAIVPCRKSAKPPPRPCRTGRRTRR